MQCVLAPCPVNIGMFRSTRPTKIYCGALFPQSSRTPFVGFGDMWSAGIVLDGYGVESCEAMVPQLVIRRVIVYVALRYKFRV